MRDGVGGVRVIYFAHVPGFIKIGYSTNANRRINSLRYASNTIAPRGIDVRSIRMLGCMEGTKRYERSLHAEFSAYRVAGEWFYDTILDPVITMLGSWADPLDDGKRTAENKSSEDALLPDCVYLSPQEVADTLKVDRRTVYRWLESGRLPATQVGRLWRIKQRDLK